MQSSLRPGPSSRERVAYGRLQDAYVCVFGEHPDRGDGFVTEHFMEWARSLIGRDCFDLDRVPISSINAATERAMLDAKYAFFNGHIIVALADLELADDAGGIYR